MTNPFTMVTNWLRKEPADIHGPNETEVLDQAIQELRTLNLRQAEVLTHIEQPDILRSLVISMNTGRNQ